MADRVTRLVATGLRVERGPALVVDSVDLTIEPGRWCGVIGANGSGKTSLLRAIAGRLPIAGGRLTVDGGDMATNRAARAQLIGFAPPIEMLPDALLARDVLRLAGGSLAEALERLGPLRDALAIDGLLARRIGSCSAGMRQRLAIACGFAGGHEIVALDEPFNWLDPVAAFDVRMAMREMVAQGRALVTALHDLATLIAACDHGVLMTAGRIALQIDGEMLAAARADPGAFEIEMIALLRAQS